MSPTLTIDLGKIEYNTRLVAELIQPYNLRLTGVTKACLGHELVGEAMLAGGAGALADSRLENIGRLRRHLPEAEIHLIRPPASGFDTTQAPDIVYVSSVSQAEQAIKESGSNLLRFCLMIESGDGREGIPRELAAAEAAGLMATGAELTGLATTIACARLDVPPEKNLAVFSSSAMKILGLLSQAREDRVSLPRGEPAKGGSLPIVSAGGSGILQLLMEPARGGGGASLLGSLSELRCGEALLLGSVPSGETEELYLPGALRDAFLLEGPVLEAYEKNGSWQALVGIGAQDVGMAPLLPRQEGITPAFATSDYLAVRVKPGAGVSDGDTLTFIPTYYALAAAMMSPYVEKRYVCR